MIDFFWQISDILENRVDLCLLQCYNFQGMSTCSKSMTLTLVAALAVMLSISSCQRNMEQGALPTSATEILNFRTISQELLGASGIYEPEEPNFFVLTSANQIGDIGSWISPAASPSLENLDYERNLAIVVFLGSRGSGGYSVTIHSLERKGNDIVIFAQDKEPPPNMSRSAMPTSPYHIVSVNRENLQGEKVTFHLVLDEKKILNRTYDLQ